MAKFFYPDLVSNIDISRGFIKMNEAILGAFYGITLVVILKILPNLI